MPDFFWLQNHYPTILIAGIAAYFFPVKEETNPEDKEDSSVEA